MSKLGRNLTATLTVVDRIRKDLAKAHSSPYGWVAVNARRCEWETVLGILEDCGGGPDVLDIRDSPT